MSEIENLLMGTKDLLMNTLNGPKFIAFLVMIGLFVFVTNGLSVLMTFYKFFLRPGKNLKKLGEWAIVTGATDGIGKAYAFELARKGLNIVLISRTEQKLKMVQEEIMAKYPKIEVSYKVVDYSKFDKKAQDEVASFVKDLKIAILINNVGVGYRFPLYLSELSDDEVQNLISMNIDSTVWMTRIVLPLMEKNKKGAIVNISSAAARNPSPLLAVYSGAKSFIELFSASLDVEYRPKGITIQSQTPLFVVSNLSKIRTASLTTPKPNVYVKSAVAWIGYDSNISPYWPHSAQLWLMSKLPSSILNNIVLSMHANLRKKGYRKEAREQEKNKKL